MLICFVLILHLASVDTYWHYFIYLICEFIKFCKIYWHFLIIFKIISTFYCRVICFCRIPHFADFDTYWHYLINRYNYVVLPKCVKFIDTFNFIFLRLIFCPFFFGVIQHCWDFDTSCHFILILSVTSWHVVCIALYMKIYDYNILKL